MNVLILAYACEPNKGSEPGVGWNWAINLSTHCNVTVLTRSNNKDNINLELKAHPYDNLKFIYYDLQILVKLKNKIPLGTKIYYYLWQKFSLAFIKKYIKTNPIDIVHHLTFNSFQVPSKLYKLGLPSIWGPIGGGITGHLESFYKLSVFEFIKELVRSIFLHISKYQIGVLRALSKYSKVIYANSETAKFLNSDPQKELIQLETGIYLNDIEQTTRFYLNNKGKTRILFVGALIPRKGLHLLIDAFLQLENNFELIVIGNGPLKLQNIIKTKNLEKRIKLMGHVDHNNLMKFYKTSDIFIFPSLRDTSGNVVLEAMSMGTPVIAFDHHGMKDILTENCAVKIKVSNYAQMVSKLVDAIILLASHPKLRQQIAQNAINRLMEKFTWEQKTKEMISVYREILSEDITSS